MPASTRLAGLVGRRLAALRRHLPAAHRGDVRGVHQARVASRRLREAVPVLTAGLKGVKRTWLRRELRRITRALGPVRELDVSLGVLDELAAPQTTSPAAELLRAHLQRERHVRREGMIMQLDRCDLDVLRMRLHAVVERAGDAGPGAAWRGGLGDRLLRRAAALRSAVDHAGALYVPERLHAVRVAAKKLRYALELTAEAGLAPTAAAVRTLKRMQDTLGRLHDLQVLQAHVTVVQAGRTDERAWPAAGLDALAHQIEDECRQLHARFVGRAGRLAELADGIRRDIVPRVRAAATARPAPLRMTLAGPRAGVRRQSGKGR